MAKFYTEIGYAVMAETVPGVDQEVISKMMYSGETLRNVVKERAGDNLNSNIAIENRFSIIADEFAYNNFHRMRYIVWHGSKWKVTGVEVQRPRLILTVGGVYNDQRPSN